MVGRRLGRYQVLALIGSGGMGQVYRARDERLERDVAIKVLTPGTITNEASRRRFRKEALALSRLNHSNIATIYDFDTIDGVDILAMELVEGASLDSRPRGTPRPERQVVAIGMQLADALAAAHAHGVVHRDLKPANLSLTADGRLKVLDFGVAQIARIEAAEVTVSATEQGMTGTWPYMSPEQLRGEPFDERADIYAAGVVMFELLTGRRPFDAPSVAGLLDGILRSPPPPPSSLQPGISPALDAIVLRALEKDPETRYQSARDFGADLRRLTAHDSTSGPIATASRPRSRARRGPIVAALLALVLLGGALTWGLRRRAEPSGSATGPASLAILPLKAIPADDEAAILSMGIPDAIITRLASTGQLAIRPTSAVAKYERVDADAQEVGRALAVQYVLTGTLQKTPERVRVGVQLVRAADGTTVWAHQVDRPRTDLLGIEDALAEQIAAALSLRMSDEGRKRFARRETRDPEAYEAYLKGRAALARLSEPAIKLAVQSFDQALARDANYALAHAGRATACLIYRLRFASQADLASWNECATHAAERAMALAPDLAESHEAAAAVYRYGEFEWHKAIEASRRALELNPGLDQPHLYIGTALYHIGVIEGVEREVRAALVANPDNNIEPLRILAAAALLDARYDDATVHTRQLDAINPRLGPQLSAQAQYYRGGLAQAEAKLKSLTGNTVNDLRAQAFYAGALAADRRTDEARALLARVLSGTYRDHHIMYSVGAAYAQLGDQSRAIDALDTAATTGLPCYPLFAKDPLLAPLRKNATFDTLLVRLRRDWEANRRKYLVTGS
jgi:TolB-like protein/tRNA A-37 threonylcarbamoyl transferase component Bud32